MTLNKYLAVLYAGIGGFIMYIFLNIFLNPDFGHSNDLLHTLEKAFFSGGFFVNHSKVGVAFSVIFLAVISILYALIVMLCTQKRKLAPAILISILPGIGLYFIRLVFYQGDNSFTAYFQKTWQIFIMYILYSIAVAWLYKWFRRKYKFWLAD